MTLQHFEDSRHDLSDLLSNALARNPYFANRNVRIELLEDEIVLKGSVNTYYLKQLAQESVRSLKSAERIRNEIEVISL
ncbi:MAG: BON domain-containing protein [Planctomycetes bacterium]|nr:BON domain-containing protein [Planctomycetota bacterium]